MRQHRPSPHASSPLFSYLDLDWRPIHLHLSHRALLLLYKQGCDGVIINFTHLNLLNTENFRLFIIQICGFITIFAAILCFEK